MTIPQFNQLPDASATQSALNECDGTLWVISPKAAINLCTNPSFETDTNNWAADSPTTFSRISDSWAGAFALSWSPATGKYLTYGVTTPLSFTGYANYAISFYCYSSSATLASTVTVELITNVGSTVFAKYTKAVTKSWSRIAFNTYIPVLNAGDYKLRISTNVSSLLIDAVQVEQVLQDGVNILGTVSQGATTYFDGSTVGTISNSQITSPQYTWQGKAHASASIRSVTAANGGIPINLQNDLGFTIVGVINADNPTK